MKKTQLNLKKRIVVFTLICIIVSFIVPSFYNNSYAETVHGQMVAESIHDERGNGYYFRRNTRRSNWRGNIN